jgi:hypothetical protein
MVSPVRSCAGRASLEAAVAGRLDLLRRSRFALAGARRERSCARGLGFLLAALFLTAGVASATPHAAHHHYMIGTRANYGVSVARVLHHEASAPGLDLALAQSNLETMAALAIEIRQWVEKTEKAQPKDELRLVREDLAKMRGLATNVEQMAAGLIPKVEAAHAGPLPKGQTMHEPSAELTEALISSSREMFQLFQEILKAHKKAETSVGIPVPQDPPKQTASK